MSEYTQTPNFALYKPNFNGDVDMWGGHLNANADTLDALLKVLTYSVGGTRALSLSAAVGASDNGILISFTSPVPGLNVVQLRSVVVGTDPNYTMELWDGVPGIGTMLYQATFIAANDFIDDASFYLPPAGSGTIYVRATNIDAVAMAVTVTLRAMAVRT